MTVMPTRAIILQEYNTLCTTRGTGKKCNTIERNENETKNQKLYSIEFATIYNWVKTWQDIFGRIYDKSSFFPKLNKKICIRIHEII
jgi:hypothetical protein